MPKRVGSGPYTRMNVQYPSLCSQVFSSLISSKERTIYMQCVDDGAYTRVGVGAIANRLDVH